ncbi:MAG: hypothetical protein PHG25_00485 [Candidatus Pacebacteria bacterium]|nr:hypothetical protein [Candidatus Paceibacterota bacterium]
MKEFNLASIEFGLKSKKDLGHVALQSQETYAKKHIKDDTVARMQWLTLYNALDKLQLLHHGGKMV